MLIELPQNESVSKVYLTINSNQLTIDQIVAAIPSMDATKVIAKGSKKTYSNDLFDYNSCEYCFKSDDHLITEQLEAMRLLLDANKDRLMQLNLQDEEIYICIRFVLYLNGTDTPDTFYDSRFLALLAQINCNLDIDLYYL